MNAKMLLDSTVAFLQRAKPFILVIMLQFASAGSAILTKSALNDGMSHYTYSVYLSLLGAIVLSPLAIFLERKDRPRLRRSMVLKIVMLALLEHVARRNLYFAGMRYTTATYAQSMNSLLPAISFVFALVLRLERVNWRLPQGRAKILGTSLIVGGAFLMTLITRPTIRLPWTRNDNDRGRVSKNFASAEHSIKGPLLIFAGCLCLASFYTLQAYTLKAYPAVLSLTSMTCAVGALQATVLTFIVERNNFSVWSLRQNSILIACVYSGVLTSGLSYYISATLTKTRGHVFVTSFNPLSMIVVAILSSIVLAEKFNYGRVFGALGVIIGLYIYIWGEQRDKQTSDANNGQQSVLGDPGDEEAVDSNSDQRDPVGEQPIEPNLGSVSDRSDEIVEVI